MLLFGGLSRIFTKNHMGHKYLLFSGWQWLHINAKIILLVFLLGLLYLDSCMVDTYIFFGALGQLLFFAFPVVPGGITLTAIIPYYVTPVDLPFDFC